MPLVRYFLFTGGVLLGLLLLIDGFAPPPRAPAARAELDRSIIRIHSAQRWPAPIPFDTSVAMPQAPPSATVASDTPAAQPARSVRRAYAALAPKPPADRPRRHARIRS